MNRAIRRHHAAKIKASIWRDINESLDKDEHRFVRGGWRNTKRYDTQERLLDLIRSNMRNEGKDRSYFCGCSWCLSNKMHSVNRDIAKMNEDFDYFFENKDYLGEEVID